MQIPTVPTSAPSEPPRRSHHQPPVARSSSNPRSSARTKQLLALRASTARRDWSVRSLGRRDLEATPCSREVVASTTSHTPRRRDSGSENTARGGLDSGTLRWHSKPTVGPRSSRRTGQSCGTIPCRRKSDATLDGAARTTCKWVRTRGHSRSSASTVRRQQLSSDSQPTC